MTTIKWTYSPEPSSGKDPAILKWGGVSPTMWSHSNALIVKKKGGGVSNPQNPLDLPLLLLTNIDNLSMYGYRKTNPEENTRV